GQSKADDASSKEGRLADEESHSPTAESTFGIDDLPGDPGAGVGSQPTRKPGDVVGRSPSTSWQGVSHLLSKARACPSRVRRSRIDCVHGDAPVDECIRKTQCYLLNGPLADGIGNLLAHGGKMLARR